MAYDPEKITYIGKTDYRNKGTLFGIKAKDRTRHVYVIGKTGMGKSTFLENMAIQDIQNGEGMAFIDPHGSSALKLLEYVPEHRINDVILFAPYDSEYPISFNVMEDVGKDRRHFVVAGLMSAFKKIWVDAWSARMEYILQNVLFALLEYPDATLLGVNRMLTDKEYRKAVVANITDQAVRSFWVDEFAKYTDKFAAEATPAIQNKVGQFTSNPMIRNLIGQPKSSFDFRRVMDEKKILIMDLSKGRLGEGNTNLIGSMLITKIYLSAMSRADVSSDILAGLPNFYFYVDEFQSFANESFADILSEARKYKLNLTIAHQYIEQMPEEVRSAVFGNVGTMVTYRVGAFDAEVLEKEYAPEFMVQDLVNLGFAQAYMKLMIDGIGSRPFSATGILPPPPAQPNFKEAIIEASRKNFAQPRAEVEAAIGKWYEPVPLPPRAASDVSAAPSSSFSGGRVTRIEGAPPPVSMGTAIQSALTGHRAEQAPRPPMPTGERRVPAARVPDGQGHSGNTGSRMPPREPRNDVRPGIRDERRGNANNGSRGAEMHSPFKQALLDAIKSGMAVEVRPSDPASRVPAAEGAEEKVRERQPERVTQHAPAGKPEDKKNGAAAPSKNRDALKEALAKLTAAPKSALPEPARADVPHPPKVDAVIVPEAKREQVKQESKSEPQQSQSTEIPILSQSKQERVPETMTREISEAELRKMLAVEMKEPE